MMARLVIVKRSDVFITKRELHERLGRTYRDGFKDGREDIPFRRGWWLGSESRAAMNTKACAHPSACGPICECDEPTEDVTR